MSFNIKLHMKWYNALIKNTMGLKLLSSKPGFATWLLRELASTMPVSSSVTMPIIQTFALVVVRLP